MNKTGFVHLEFPKSTPLFSTIFIKFSLNLLLLTITALSIPRSALIYLKNLSQNIFTKQPSRSCGLCLLYFFLVKSGRVRLPATEEGKPRRERERAFRSLLWPPQSHTTTPPLKPANHAPLWSPSLKIVTVHYPRFNGLHNVTSKFIHTTLIMSLTI